MSLKTAKTNKLPKLPSLPYGQGSMSYRANGTVMYRKRIGDKKKSVTVYGSSAKKVMEKMAEYEKNMKKVEYKKETITLYDAMMNWVDLYKSGDLKATSTDTLKKTIRNYIGKYDIGQTRLSAIDSDMIQRHINMLNKKENYSHSAIKKCYNAFTAFYEHLYDARKIEYNIMMPVKMIKEENIIKQKKKIAHFSEEDIKKFIAEAIKIDENDERTYQYGLCLAANIFLGMRGGELIALKWKDVDFDNNTIYVHENLQNVSNPDYDTEREEEMKSLGITKNIYVIQDLKNKQPRYIHMNPSAKRYLLMQKQYSEFTSPDDYVCGTSFGTHATIKYLSDNISLIEKHAGTDVQEKSSHIIRHTCASLYFAKGIRIELIAAMLGHSVDVCRETYIEFEEKQKKDAVKLITDFDAVVA